MMNTQLGFFSVNNNAAPVLNLDNLSVNIGLDAALNFFNLSEADAKDKQMFLSRLELRYQNEIATSELISPFADKQRFYKANIKRIKDTIIEKLKLSEVKLKKREEEKEDFKWSETKKEDEQELYKKRKYISYPQSERSESVYYSQRDLHNEQKLSVNGVSKEYSELASKVDGMLEEISKYKKNEQGRYNETLAKLDDLNNKLGMITNILLNNPMNGAQSEKYDNPKEFYQQNCEHVEEVNSEWVEPAVQQELRNADSGILRNKGLPNVTIEERAAEMAKNPFNHVLSVEEPDAQKRIYLQFEQLIKQKEEEFTLKYSSLEAKEKELDNKIKEMDKLQESLYSKVESLTNSLKKIENLTSELEKKLDQKTGSIFSSKEYCSTIKPMKVEIIDSETAPSLIPGCQKAEQLLMFSKEKQNGQEQMLLFTGPELKPAESSNPDYSKNKKDESTTNSFVKVYSFNLNIPSWRV